jgi:hypothetical protein
LEIADRWANGVRTNPKGKPLSSRTSTLDGDLVVTGRNIVIFYCFEMLFDVQFVVQIPNLVFRFSSFLFTFILKCFKFTTPKINVGRPTGESAEVPPLNFAYPPPKNLSLAKIVAPLNNKEKLLTCPPSI